jgi:hypothetical protein
MKKTAFIWICLLVSLFAEAQEATKILDKSAAKLRAAGNVKIAFTL